MFLLYFFFVSRCFSDDTRLLVYMLNGVHSRGILAATESRNEKHDKGHCLRAGRVIVANRSATSFRAPAQKSDGNVRAILNRYYSPPLGFRRPVPPGTVVVARTVGSRSRGRLSFVYYAPPRNGRQHSTAGHRSFGPRNSGDAKKKPQHPVRAGFR